MSLIDIFKNRASKKREGEKENKVLFDKKDKEKEEKKRIKIEAKPKKIEKTKKKPKKFDEESSLTMILKAAHVTEKAGDLAGKNQYIFKVYPGANKIKVKEAAENIFKVDVISVKIINVPKKKRRLGKISGWRKGYKKAIVGIKKDQKIDILPR